MTARNGKAEWHGSVEIGSGTITVGDGVFEGAYSYESRFGEAAGGIDERQFQTYAEAAKRDCPVSRALAGIPEITLTAKLRTADSIHVTAPHDRLAAPASEAGDRQDPDLGVDQGVRS
jgi:hypothetical protein